MSMPESTIKVTNVTPCGDGKVCMTIELVVDAHRMVEISSEMLHVGAKGVSDAKTKKSSSLE